MNFDTRRLLRFGGTFVLWMAIFYAVYMVVAPGYRAFLVKSSNLILARIEPLVVIKIIDDGEKDSVDRLDFVGWKINYYTDQQRSIGQAFALETNSLKGMYLSLVLLPALILTTPIRWWDRLRLLGWGLLILTVCNIITILVFAHLRGYYSVVIPADQRTFLWSAGAFVWGIFKIVFSVQAQLLSVAIWGLLCWRYLFGSKEEIAPGADESGPVAPTAESRSPDREVPAPPSRSASCPCGSGKKFKHCCGR